MSGVDSSPSYSSSCRLEHMEAESGGVYSVVSKPSAAEIPQKLELLLEELN